MTELEDSAEQFEQIYEKNKRVFSNLMTMDQAFGGWNPKLAQLIAFAQDHKLASTEISPERVGQLIKQLSDLTLTVRHEAWGLLEEADVDFYLQQINLAIEAININDEQFEFTRNGEWDLSNQIGAINELQEQIDWDILQHRTAKELGEQIPREVKEELGSLKYQLMTPEQLLEDPELLQEQAQTIYDNYVSSGYGEEFAVEKANAFKNRVILHSLQDENQFLVHTVMNESNLVGFIATDASQYETGKINSSIGSLHVKDEYQNKKIGVALIRTILEQSKQNYGSVSAECNSENFMTQKYIEAGFIAVSSYETNPKNVLSYKLEYVSSNQNFAKQYYSKTCSLKEIKQLLNEQDENLVVKQLNHPPARDDLRLPPGMGLTRYIQEGEQYWLVFEKLH